MERTLRHLRRAVVPETTSSGGSPATIPNLTLINTLLGVEEPQWHDEVPAPFSSETEAEGCTDDEIKWFGDQLNDSQKEAIRFCLKAQSVACIHGPPGVSSSEFGGTSS
jgi:DNA polymerase alpha-associated DNA helicase A